MNLPSNSYINLFHLFFVAPLLLYLGQVKSDAPQIIYSLLIFLSLGVLLFHSWRLTTGNYSIINIFHLLFVAPFLFYIGWNYGMVDARFFMLANVLGMGVILYHGWRLYDKIKNQ